MPSSHGSTFLMGVIWWDRTKNQLGGMECNNYLPFTCDLKGGLNDITITWDGRKFEIDEIETHNGRLLFGTSIGPTSRQRRSYRWAM